MWKIYATCLIFEQGDIVKKRLTILLGAGAVYEATKVSTTSITKMIIKECKGYKLDSDKSQSVVDYICKYYWDKFGNR